MPYSGLLVGVVASTIWGTTPIFFKMMDTFTPIEVVAHRIIWTMAVMMGLAVITTRMPRLWTALTTWRELRSILISSVLMAVNWFTFIYAVSNDLIVEASLGYYIYPLMVVAIGVFGLGEKLHRLEWIAVALAFFGVVLKAYESGGAPVISLVVSTTFVAYTLFNKTRETGPIVGLLAEAIVLTPMAMIFVGYLMSQGQSQFVQAGISPTLLAITTGVVTALPLAMYIASSRAIGIAVAGLLFYLAPSLHLVIGVLIYQEPFSLNDGFAFGLIWLALAVLAFKNFSRKEIPAAK